MPIRVLISSKHKLACEGIAAVLLSQSDMMLAGVSDDGAHTNALCDRVDPNVIVIGMQNHDAQDQALMDQITRHQPTQNMVVFSCETDRHAIVEILDAGVKGYVSMTSSMDELLAAIRCAATGRIYLCQTAAAEMIKSITKSSTGEIVVKGPLGGREEQVLCLIADGFSSKEIARNLLISPNTVDVHRRNIMRKIGLHKVADLTRYAIRNQMVAV
jgi:two-component system NarL family response regulator